MNDQQRAAQPRGSIPDIASDPDALEAFYRDHIEAIGRFVARRVDDPHLAADLTSEVFLAAIDAARQYLPERGSPQGWLFGIARHVMADHARRRGRERSAFAREGGRRHLAPDALARIEERIDAERSMRRVYRALSNLPERDRRLFELVALDGLTITDAAAVLGITAGTARVRLHRSRAKVERLLRPADNPFTHHSIQEAT